MLLSYIQNLRETATLKYLNLTQSGVNLTKSTAFVEKSLGKHFGRVATHTDYLGILQTKVYVAKM